MPGGRSVQELADALPISRPAVSRHLRLLKQAGLVRRGAASGRAGSTGSTTRASRRSGPTSSGSGARRRRVSRLVARTPRRRAAPTRGASVIEPIRLAFDVDCPADHAFEVWTARIDRWWPADHTASGDAATHVVLEGRPGGRIFERTPSGAEHDWGEVTVWEPPSRLGYLWHLRRDRADATEVEIRFVAAGDGDDAGRDRAPRLGAAWGRAARSSGTATAVAGRRSCRTTLCRGLGRGPRAGGVRLVASSPSAEGSERLRDVALEDAAPLAGQLPGDDGIVCDQPGKVAQPVLHDLLVGDVARRGGRRRAGEVGPADRAESKARASSASITTTKLRITASRSRRHDVEWTSRGGPDDVAHDPVDDLDRMIGRAQLEQPWHRPVRPGQLEVVAVQPDDEDLGLDGTLDVEAPEEGSSPPDRTGETLHLPYNPHSVWITRRAHERPSEPSARDRSYPELTPAGPPIPRRRHLPLECPEPKEDSRWPLATTGIPVPSGPSSRRSRPRSCCRGRRAGPRRAARPSQIALPNGWAPEGITAGPGTTVFVGSLSAGGIWRGDVRTGQGAVIPGTRGDAGRRHEYEAAANRLWVAGGGSG